MTWRLRPIGGQRVRFAEVGTRVARVITTTNARRGSVRFRPATGPAGRRRIVAYVEQNGRPRTNLRVASCTAPGVARPAKPAGLRATHEVGDVLVVSWTSP